MKKRSIVSLILMVLLLSSLTAQGRSEQAKQTKSANTVAVTHELGTTQVPVKAERILVFDLGALDILDVIGIDIIGLGKGATLPDHLAQYADSKRYPVVGSLHEPDFEKVFEMRPDLILIGTRAAGAYDELSKIAPTVLVSLPASNYMQTLSQNLSLFAAIFPEKQSELVTIEAQIHDEIAQIREQVQEHKYNALFLMVNAGSLSVFGGGSRFSILYDDFGFAPSDTTIQTSTHGQSSSYEYLLNQNPDYLFVLDRSLATGENNDGRGAQSLLNNTLVRRMKAHQQNQVYYVDAVSWYVASGGINATRTMIKDLQNALQR